MIRVCLLTVYAAFVVINGFSFQPGFQEQVELRLNQFYSNKSAPGIVLTFNQPEYSAGDTVFFKVHSHASPTAEKIKHVIDIAVLDVNRKLLLRNRTILQNGEGFSQLILPPDLQPGVYTLVAYPNGHNSSRTYFKHALMVVGEKMVEISAKPTRLSYYPEGGHIVKGVSNNILVFGVAPGDSGRVVNSNNHRVTSFAASGSGLAKFSLKPTEEEDYYLIYNNHRLRLEGIITDPGIVLTLDDSQTSEINISVETNSVNQFLSEKIYLLSIVGGKIIEYIPIAFAEDAHQKYSISRNKIGYGLCRFIAVRDDGKMLAERMVYTAAPGDQPIKVNLNKDTFNTREKVELTIMLAGVNEADRATLALAVYRKDLFRNTAQPGSLAQAWIQLEVDMPSEMDNNRIEQREFNDYLIAAKPKDTWKEIWDPSTLQEKRKNPVYFTGTVVSNLNQTIKDSTLITFWLKDQDFLYDLYTKDGGRIEFPLFMNFTDDEILYSASFKQRPLRNITLQLDSPGIPLVEPMQFKTTAKDNLYHRFSELRSGILTSYNYYNQKNKMKVSEKDGLLPADVVIDLEKFKPFTTITEMLNEVVPALKAKKVKDENQLRVFLKESAMFAQSNPIVVIDGVATDNIDHFMSMTPSIIKTIGVVNSRNKLVRYGVLGINGIVVVETSRSESLMLSSLNSVFVKGIDQPLKNHPLRYSDNTDRIPYLRPALHWRSSLILKKDELLKEEFYTADDTGEYVMEIKGMDNRGAPIEAQTTFFIKP